MKSFYRNLNSFAVNTISTIATNHKKIHYAEHNESTKINTGTNIVKIY